MRIDLYAIIFRMLLGALFSLAIPSANAATYTPPSNNRVDINLSSAWKFNKSDVVGAEATSFNDSSWSNVTLPHTWNSVDGQNNGDQNYYRGIGWYRSHYTIPSSYAGRAFFLQFDGANIVADVYLNGTWLGQHQGGFAAFRFNATSAANVGGDNVIAVKVNNAYNADIPALTGDYTFFGGLYRDVHLLVTDKLRVRTTDYASSGVYLKQTNVSAASADLQVTSKIFNDNTVSKSVTVNTVIVDAANNIVKTLTSTQSIGTSAEVDVVQNTTITSPHLWNGRADPYLYKAYVEVKDGSKVTDLVQQPLGFRFYSVDPNKGFFLNGQYLDLHGANKNQDRKDKGFAISQADMDEDNALITEVGATVVRVDHYQNAQHVYDLFDQTGLIAWGELTLNFKINGTTAFSNNAQQQLIEMIRQNYNHPSILFWSLGNELTQNPGPDPRPLLTTLNTLAHNEDSTRLTTYASNAVDNDSINFISDIQGLNRYFGWYTGGSNGTGDYTVAGSWADNLHATYPNRAFAISEYGAGASISFHSENPTRMDHSEEYQNNLHESFWKALKTRPFLWQKTPWTMFDFASDGKNEGDHPSINDKGLVTYDRKTKKDIFYWYKSNWTTTPTVRITSQTYLYRPTATTDIKVYSNTDSVELKVNGVSQGSKTSTDHIFKWTGVSLPNAMGSNTVQAIGTKGSNTYTDTTTFIRGAVRLNAGSVASYTDGSGKVYSGDAYYNGNSNSGLYSTTNTIGNTTDQALYQNYRAGTFTYTIPVENGTYSVYLKFVDPTSTASGQRVFSVTAEGATILSNFDIFAAVGQNNAIEKTAVVTVTDGKMTLAFTPSAGKAILSGISLLKQ